MERGMVRESERRDVLARVSAAIPADLGRILEEYERRYAAFERVTDASTRAHDLVAAADRAQANLTRVHA
jgi:hypothetical protein